MFIGVGIFSIIVYKWPISINKFFIFLFDIFDTLLFFTYICIIVYLRTNIVEEWRL